MTLRIKSPGKKGTSKTVRTNGQKDQKQKKLLLRK